MARAEEEGVEGVGGEGGQAEELAPGGQEEGIAGGEVGIAAQGVLEGEAAAVEEMLGLEKVGEFIGGGHGGTLEVPVAGFVVVDEGGQGDEGEEEEDDEAEGAHGGMIKDEGGRLKDEGETRGQR